MNLTAEVPQLKAEMASREGRGDKGVGGDKGAWVTTTP